MAQKPDYTFDKNGLRFSIEHLNSMNNKIFKLPIEKAAEYVDTFTYHDTGSHNEVLMLIDDSLANPWVTKYHKKYNTTSFGNLAFIALYANHEQLRKNARLLFENLCYTRIHGIVLYMFYKRKKQKELAALEAKEAQSTPIRKMAIVRDDADSEFPKIKVSLQDTYKEVEGERPQQINTIMYIKDAAIPAAIKEEIMFVILNYSETMGYTFKTATYRLEKDMVYFDNFDFHDRPHFLEFLKEAKLLIKGYVLEFEQAMHIDIADKN